MSDNTKSPPLTRLDGPLQWSTWRSRIINKIILCGYGVTVSTGKRTPIRRVAITDTDDTPDVTAESEEAFQTRLENWTEKQLGAYALVKEYCGLIARTLLETAESINEPIYTAIDVRLRAEFELAGSGRYQELCHNFTNLTLAKCANISEYSANFTQLHDEMVTIHVHLSLPEPFLVQAYLGGLGDSFKEFITAFNLQHSLVPTAINGVIQTAVSLPVARRKVEEHASRLQSDSNVALYNRQRRGTTTDVPVCKHCNKRHKGTCWTVDPSKAPKAWIERNAATESANPSKKRKSTDDAVFGDTKTEGDQQHNVILTGGSEEALYFTSHDTTREYMAIHRGINLYDCFILDSGATGSLIGRKDLFMPGTYTTIDLAESNGIGGAKLKPVGQGTLRIRCRNGRWIQVPNTQYSPNAGVNLLSLNAMWPYIQSISKTSDGLTFTQGGDQFSATITGGLLMLDTHSE